MRSQQTSNKENDGFVVMNQYPQKVRVQPSDDNFTNENDNAIEEENSNYGCYQADAEMNTESMNKDTMILNESNDYEAYNEYANTPQHNYEFFKDNDSMDYKCGNDLEVNPLDLSKKNLRREKYNLSPSESSEFYNNSPTFRQPMNKDANQKEHKVVQYIDGDCDTFNERNSHDRKRSSPKHSTICSARKHRD